MLVAVVGDYVQSQSHGSITTGGINDFVTIDGILVAVVAPSSPPASLSPCAHAPPTPPAFLNTNGCSFVNIQSTPIALVGYTQNNKGDVVVANPAVNDFVNSDV